MSWDGYIDTLLNATKDEEGSQQVTRACLIDLESGEDWNEFHTVLMKLHAGEGQVIAQCFKSRDFTAFKENGIHVDGMRYEFLHEGDDKVVVGKKENSGTIAIRSSKTGIVIAHGWEGARQDIINRGVSLIADYLEEHLGM